MAEVFVIDGGSYGFRVHSVGGRSPVEQVFKPFSAGKQPMTQTEAQQIGAAFESPAGPWWTGSEAVPRIQVEADKAEFLADGADAAIVTARVADAASNEPIYVSINGGAESQIQASAGVADLAVRATSPGSVTVQVRSARYGINSIILEAV